MKQPFLYHLLGTDDYAFFAAAMFFTLIGAFISLLIQALNRNITSPRTPFQFSWDYLLSDNNIRILYTTILNIVVLFLQIRFMKDLIGQELNLLLCVVLGYGVDKAVQNFKTKIENKA